MVSEGSHCTAHKTGTRRAVFMDSDIVTHALNAAAAGSLAMLAGRGLRCPRMIHTDDTGGGVKFTPRNATPPSVSGAIAWQSRSRILKSPSGGWSRS